MPQTNKPRTQHSPIQARSQAGFSVIEVLMTISLLGVLGTLTLNSFQGWLPRLHLRDAAQQTQSVISRARLEAIQRGVTTVVTIDPSDGSIVSFADVNGDPMMGSAGYANYLKFDPDPALGNKQTDYEISRIQLNSSTLGTPEFDPVDGFTEAPGAAPGSYRMLVFSAGGTTVDAGSFRLADGNGKNVIEVAITSLAGKVERRKYLEGIDSPTSTPGFFPEGQRADGTNVWVWY